MLWWAWVLASLVVVGVAVLVALRAWPAFWLALLAVVPLTYGIFLGHLVSDCYDCDPPPTLEWLAVGIALTLGAWMIGAGQVRKHRAARPS